MISNSEVDGHKHEQRSTTKVSHSHHAVNPYAGWNDTFPHQNWKYAEMEHLRDEGKTCVMCFKRNIKFLHRMEYPTGYHAGVDVDCAGKMVGNSQSAQARQRKAEQRAVESATWISSTEWKTKGSETTLTI